MNTTPTYVTMAALQKHGTDGDAQLAAFSRYAEVHFVPDIFGDMVFNDVASDVIRQSTLTGMQGDGSYIVNGQHTLRAGFAVSGEQTNVTDVSTVMPGAVGAVTGPPFDITDQTFPAWLEYRHLCSGRMEADEPIDGEYGPALRPIVSIRRCQPAQPALRHRL